MAQLEYIDYRVQTFRAMGNISAGFKILDGLEYKFVAGFDNMSSKAKTDMDVRAHGVRNVGNAQINNVEVFTLTINNLLTYSKTFGSHSINLMAGHEYQKYPDSYEGVYTNNDEFNFWPYTSNISGGGLIHPPWSGLSTSYLQSFFARVNYVLANKYLFTATVGRDGSSKFANNKYGTFPSVALAWTHQAVHAGGGIHEELHKVPGRIYARPDRPCAPPLRTAWACFPRPLSLGLLLRQQTKPN